MLTGHAGVKLAMKGTESESVPTLMNANEVKEFVAVTQSVTILRAATAVHAKADMSGKLMRRSAVISMNVDRTFPCVHSFQGVSTFLVDTDVFVEKISLIRLTELHPVGSVLGSRLLKLF